MRTLKPGHLEEDGPITTFSTFYSFCFSPQVPLHLVVKYFLEGYPNYSNIVVWLSIIVGQPLAILCYFHDYYVSSVQVCVRKCSLCQALRENGAGSRVSNT